MFSYFLCNSSNNSLDSQLSQQVTEAGTPTILPTITFPNKPSKSYQCTQGSRQSKATSGDLCAGEFLCPGALCGLWLAKGHGKGGCRECWEKKDFFKRMVVACNQHGHRAQKDNQLGCKCSPKGGLGWREALFPLCLSTKCVCGEVSWWQLNAPNPYTSASHCFTYLLKGWFMHSSR